MNPRPGGGEVRKFDLRLMPERFGATVLVLPRGEEVTTKARGAAREPRLALHWDDAVVRDPLVALDSNNPYGGPVRRVPDDVRVWKPACSGGVSSPRRTFLAPAT